MMDHPLKKYREATGKSLEELAVESKTSRATLSRIENGLQTPSLGLIERIREATGGAIRADDFLPFRGEIQGASIHSGDGEISQEAEIVGDAA